MPTITSSSPSRAVRRMSPRFAASRFLGEGTVGSGRSNAARGHAANTTLVGHVPSRGAHTLRVRYRLFELAAANTYAAKPYGNERKEVAQYEAGATALAVSLRPGAADGSARVGSVGAANGGPRRERGAGDALLENRGTYPPGHPAREDSRLRGGDFADTVCRIDSRVRNWIQPF